MADQHTPRERGILFNAPMVRAVLDGTKTQTRRAVKPQPVSGQGMVNAAYCGHPNLWLRDGHCDTADPAKEWRCPFGQPGDRMWVRETFMPAPNDVPSHDATRWNIAYAAGGQAELMAPAGYNPMLYNYERWTPSIHMPRWASRITLEITRVRVERLQKISVRDAIAEGCRPLPPDPACSQVAPEDYVAGYRELWEQINGPGSWDANPWVWVVSFRRLEVPSV